jgi:predicted cupin superfamily sugar epimerase
MTELKTAADIIRALDLKPHPEGGHYRETFRDPRVIEGRAVSTSIYFLLKRRSARTGIASIRWRSGTTMPARR